MFEPEIRAFYEQHIEGYCKQYKALEKFFESETGHQDLGKEINRILTLQEIEEAASEQTANAALIGGEVEENNKKLLQSIAKEFEALAKILGCENRDQLDALAKGYKSFDVMHYYWRRPFEREPTSSKLETAFYRKIHRDVYRWLGFEGGQDANGTSFGEFWNEIASQLTDMITLKARGTLPNPRHLVDDRSRYDQYELSQGVPNFFVSYGIPGQVNAYNERKKIPLGIFAPLEMMPSFLPEGQGNWAAINVPFIPDLNEREKMAYFLSCAKSYGIAVPDEITKKFSGIRIPKDKVAQIADVMARMRGAKEDVLADMAESVTHAADLARGATVVTKIIEAGPKKPSKPRRKAAQAAAAVSDKTVTIEGAPLANTALLPAPTEGPTLPESITGMAEEKERMPVNSGEEKWAERPLRSDDDHGTGTPG